MSIVMEINPFDFFVDADGDALDSGFIYIGEANKDPRQYPVTVYFDKDLTIPASMPLRTSNGYVVRNGSPTFLYINGNYSVLVQDKKHRQVYYVPDFLLIGSGQAVSAGDLAGPDGSKQIGYERDPLTGNIDTVQEMLDAQRISIWEYAPFITSRPSPLDPSTWDWTPAFQAAALVGRTWVNAGTYRVNRPTKVKIAGGGFDCEGVDQVRFIIDGSFVGNNVFELGDSDTATITKTAFFSGASIDLGGTTNIAGVSLFGIRDGSSVREVVMTNFGGTAFRTSKAGSGVGVASGLMSEGVVIENIHAISSPVGVIGSVFDLNGLFETSLKGCKALGYTLAENNAVGFSVGAAAESRGVSLEDCSSANFVNFSGSTNINKGLVYGAWARDCWDSRMTFENIDGVGTEYHGSSVSGTLQPLNCRSRDVRPFFSAAIGKLNPLYKFRACNACQVTGVNHFSTVKQNFRFTNEGGINNYAFFDINAEPSVAINVLVAFEAGSSNSNLVEGHASGVTIRKSVIFTPDQQFYAVLPNDAYWQTDQFWTALNMGTANKFRFRNSALDSVFTIDDTSLAGSATAMSVLWNKGGVMTLDRVTIGAADSGGAGKRLLVVPN